MPFPDAPPGAAGADLCAAPATARIEHQGQVYEIHAALAGGFLRQADYTRKTQLLAEDRKALSADREALDARLETLWGSLGELILWVALNRAGPFPVRTGRPRP
jgi:hypothetical protein